MIYKKLLLGGAILLLAPFIVLNSCTKAQVQEPFVDPNCIDTVSFSSQIAPMIQTYCISCHDTGNSTGYTFTNHTNISTNASDILNAMKGQGGMQMMPQGGPALHDSLIQQFTCWTGQGKLNN